MFQTLTGEVSRQNKECVSFVNLMNLGFPGSSVVKNPPANAGDMASIPRSGRSLGEGNGNPLQCSCLGNPMDRGAMESQRVGHD